MRLFNRPVSHTAGPVTIVVAALAAFAVLAVLTLVALVAPRGVPGLKYYNLNAEFEDAAQIADLSEVRMAGRHVGAVKSSGLNDGKATIELQFFPGQKPLPADTTARIRLKGLLGAKFVDVLPGRQKKTIPDGGTLPQRQTSTAVELLDVLQALDEPTRQNLQTTVGGLGKGFLGRGDELNNMFDVGPDFYGGARDVSASILRRQGAAGRLFPSLESLAGAYDPVREELATGFRPEARALEAFVAKRAELDRTLVEAPPSLTALREGLDAGTPLLNETAGLARSVTRLTVRAPAALRETSEFLDKATPALRATRPLLENLADAVPPTLAFLRRLDPVIEPATRALRNSLRPLLTLGAHGCDVLYFGRNWRSSLGFGVQTGFGDPAGTLDEGIPGLGPMNSLRVVVMRPLELEFVSGDAPPGGPDIGRNPYPDPCVAVKERLP